MAFPSSITLRGTRAAQPAATAVTEGVLYCVTDEADIVERSNGAAWQAYSPTAGSLGINQLTGDVTAGPGTGSQAATIANNAVTTAKILDDNVTLAKIANAAANDKLLGSGNAGIGINYVEITLGSGLTMTGTTLAASGSGGTVTTTGSPASNELVKFSGASSVTTGDLATVLTDTGTPAVKSIGYLGAPQMTDQDDYTLALTDSGKHYYHVSATPHTLTIPANASIAFPIGTIIAGVNENGAGALTIAITTDTLRWGSSTGSRTVAADGTFSLLKVTSTLWRLTGDGIT